MTGEAAWLLALLLTGHFLGDFTPLSTRGMLRAKAVGAPLGPIAAHAAVHGALLAVAVAVVARPTPGLLAAVVGFEVGTHFLIDLGRGRLMRRHPRLGDPAEGAFWWTLGLDQLAHGLVLIVVAVLVT